ncbi:hypothetical protein CF319_g2059 [Tilletia indica]|nr:hypothetical protein CF319_g2059 [Tilletia indica]
MHDRTTISSTKPTRPLSSGNIFSSSHRSSRAPSLFLLLLAAILRGSTSLCKQSSAPSFEFPYLPLHHHWRSSPLEQADAHFQKRVGNQNPSPLSVTAQLLFNLQLLDTSADTIYRLAMARSGASLTTFFVVGPEEYVEFAESMGSKAFLQHIWDNSVTPISAKDFDGTSRLHATGARVVRPKEGPPRIEFPTVKRIRGNKYKPTGKWISWQALKRLNPLAVTDPPDLAVYMARGGQVGTGSRRAPGAYLEQTSSKNMIPFAVPEEPDPEQTGELMPSQSHPSINPDDPSHTSTAPPSRATTPSLSKDSQGWIGIGSAHSIHAPPRAVVIRRARQTAISSPAALAAKAALAAGRPGPSPLANTNAAPPGSHATVTPANAHLIRASAAAAAAAGGASPSSPLASSSITPVSTPPARASPRFSHAPSASVGNFPSPSSSVGTPPSMGNASLHQQSPTGSAGSGGSRAGRRPNLRVPMPPPPQHLSSSFRAGPPAGGGTVAGSGLTPGSLTPGHASGARTPLSATHPPPETPLKHQRRRAKDMADAMAAGSGGEDSREGAATGTGTDKAPQKVSADGNFVETEGDQDPMDFTANMSPFNTGIGIQMSPGNVTPGAGGGAAAATAAVMGSALRTPDLRGLAGLKRADVERTRLAFERTAAGQDPLLSASANVRTTPGASGVPFGVTGNGGFGFGSGWGDWAGGMQGANGGGLVGGGGLPSSTMAPAIAEARRSSLPPLTPATEGPPAGSWGGPPPASSQRGGSGYRDSEEEGMMGAGLGLEPGEAMGQRSPYPILPPEPGSEQGGYGLPRPAPDQRAVDRTPIAVRTRVGSTWSIQEEDEARPTVDRQENDQDAGYSSLAASMQASRLGAEQGTSVEQGRA